MFLHVSSVRYLRDYELQLEFSNGDVRIVNLENELHSKAKQTSDALRILNRMVQSDPELRALIDDERVGAQVAREIYELRTARGLTQKALADRVGTAQSVIARVEDADYEGHSLRMLRRIAHALDACVTVHLIPRKPTANHSKER